jgi:uncharacterized protein YkwD
MRTAGAVALGLLLGGLLAAGAGAEPGAPARTRAATCANVNLLPTPADRVAVDSATLCLINRIRLAHHLGALKSNHDLRVVAARQVSSMVTRNYFADDTPSGRTPMAMIAATRYAAHAASLSTAENIGWGTGSDATPQEIVLAWMNSPEHRAIILTGEYEEAGVGVNPSVPSVLEVSPPGATYAIEFGLRQPS